MVENNQGTEDPKSAYAAAIARINQGIQGAYDSSALDSAFMETQALAMQVSKNPLEANTTLVDLAQRLRINATKNGDSQNAAKWGQLETGFQSVVDALSPKPGRQPSAPKATPQRSMSGRKN